MSTRRVWLVGSDLFFFARVTENARALGVGVETVDSRSVLERMSSDPPDLLILDLHAPGDLIGLARALKAGDRVRAVPIVAYYSHVDEARREAARNAGVDQVLPRSAFTARLPALLSGEALAGGKPC